MLLGNCINGVSLALNSLFSSLVECSREIELLLSFGANERESTERLVRESIRNGAMPQLNSMAIIGLISTPGECYNLNAKLSSRNRSPRKKATDLIFYGRIRETFRHDDRSDTRWYFSDTSGKISDSHLVFHRNLLIWNNSNGTSVSCSCLF